VVLLSQLGTGTQVFSELIGVQQEKERLAKELVDLEEQRSLFKERWRQALGYSTSKQDPPMPCQVVYGANQDHEEPAWEEVLARNPQLNMRRAELEQAEAELARAYAVRFPLFTLGFQADMQAQPVAGMPSVEITLPILRKKLAAQLGEAQALRNGKAALLTLEQTLLAVQFIEAKVLLKAALRERTLLQAELIPKAQIEVNTTFSEYVVGAFNFTGFMQAKKKLLALEIALLNAQVKCEIAYAELYVRILGLQPLGGS
jgi:outer membrane protein TolC